MCEVLMEIMKKDIDKKVADARIEGFIKGFTESFTKSFTESFMESFMDNRVREAVVIYRDEMNLDDSSIISKIRNKFGLTQEAAEQYVLA